MIDFDKEDNRSRLYQLSENSLVNTAKGNSTIYMKDEPNLAPMPKNPTLIDFFKNRFIYTQHLLQSARLAKQEGHDEKVILACLLHDIAVSGFIRGDHGYFGAEMVAPYVDEEITWAIKTHQALRFFPAKEFNYEYPKNYLNWFGEDYEPDEYIINEYKNALSHKWYPTAMAIVVNDLYSFDSSVAIEPEEFIDIIGRNFKQPDEGLGFDNSPCAHIWRTIIRPNKFL